MRQLIFILTVAALSLPSALQAQTDSYEGITSPYRIIEVATQESGIVKDLHVKVGDRVEQGQPIALLDNALITASLAIAKARMQATASFNGANARYEASLKRLATFEQLATTGGARQDELDQARSNVVVTQADVDSQREAMGIAELEYKRLKTQVGLRTIKSPITGVVVSVDREPGELVGASQSVIARIADLDRLNLISHLPQTVAEQAALGNEVPVQLSNGDMVQGVFEFISPVVDPRSATIEVKVLLKNTGGAIRSGMRANLMMERIISSITQ